MISIERTKKPKSLVDHADSWTKELMKQISLCGEYSKVKDKYRNKYRQKDVQSALEEMYQEKCCYCETNFAASSFGNIEHLRPKALTDFHHLSFEWTNLHWSCGRCNNSKSNKWNESFPILDPTVDDITKHLEFDPITGLVTARNNSKRGQTTIEHADLNRTSLVKARNRLLSYAFSKMGLAKKAGEFEIYRSYLIDEIEKNEIEYAAFLKRLIKFMDEQFT